MSKCDFNKIAKKLYWNHTSAWAFSCKFTAYFQNTFSYENLWVAVSVNNVNFQNIKKTIAKHEKSETSEANFLDE